MARQPTTITHEEGTMVSAIPFTHYGEFVAQAKAIQQSLAKGSGSTAALRQALVDLADLAVRALAETNDVFEGMAALVMALHHEVKRRPQARRTISRRP
jgi:hypothetical protein